MAFTIFFAIEGANEAFVLTLPHPNQGSLPVTIIRFLASLGILGAILWKNLAGDKRAATVRFKIAGSPEHNFQFVL